MAAVTDEVGFLYDKSAILGDKITETSSISILKYTLTLQFQRLLRADSVVQQAPGKHFHLVFVI